MIELLPENDPVSALRFLLLEAVNREVSDIHIEPMDRDCRVRFRIGGDAIIGIRKNFHGRVVGK